MLGEQVSRKGSKSMTRTSDFSRQLLKYLSVGGISNGLAYGFYVIIAMLGVRPVVAMTMVYIVASGFSFAVNKSWTFESDSSLWSALVKYVAIQFLGFVTNLALLTGLHYGLGLPHYLAQLVGMGFVAIELFLLNRYYVFTSSNT